MASLVDYGAALRFVQTRAEALGHGFAGPHPRALFTCLRSSLNLGRRLNWFGGRSAPIRLNNF